MDRIKTKGRYLKKNDSIVQNEFTIYWKTKSEMKLQKLYVKNV